MNSAPYLSIITPLYNRADLLSRCYDSLRRQSDFDFEWIIVDDGSTDEPEPIVKRFATDHFPITFLQKENGGKHTALNAAHPYIHGKFVLILDSDDFLTDTAVQQVKCAWCRFDATAEIGIVTFLKGPSETTPNCYAADEAIPVDIMRYKRTIVHSSDCCEVIRAELFTKYPFPVFENERFISECALWNRVSFTHKCVYINQVIYICEYLDGGLTKSGRALRIRNPLGGMFISDLRMDQKNYFTQRIKYGLLYTCYGLFARKNPRKMASMCRSRLLMWLCLPFGWLLYRHWNASFAKSTQTH